MQEVTNVVKRPPKQPNNGLACDDEANSFARLGLINPIPASSGRAQRKFGAWSPGAPAVGVDAGIFSDREPQYTGLAE